MLCSRLVANGDARIPLIGFVPGSRVVGVISYTVSQPTRDVGMQPALGAPLDGVTRLFVRYGPALSGHWRYLRSGGGTRSDAPDEVHALRGFEVSPADPLTYIAASSALIVAALVGRYLPARRVAQVDPAEAIRAE